MRKIIEVRELVKNYGSFQAVKGISFEVAEGEIFGLLGPNGAGKSTTLEIIETLREKTSGKVYVDGIDLDKAPHAIKKIIARRRAFELKNIGAGDGPQKGTVIFNFKVRS